ncbi:MAG: hypothetical protein GY679_01150 [Mycoplasma sp.]|nr:hypothetical protein [Mycoplasma sp.]
MKTEEKVCCINAVAKIRELNIIEKLLLSDIISHPKNSIYTYSNTQIMDRLFLSDKNLISLAVQRLKKLRYVSSTINEKRELTLLKKSRVLHSKPCFFIIKNPQISMTANLVYDLIKKYERKKKYFFMTNEEIGSTLGFSTNTIRKAIKCLTKNELIKKTRDSTDTKRIITSKNTKEIHEKLGALSENKGAKMKNKAYEKMIEKEEICIDLKLTCIYRKGDKCNTFSIFGCKPCFKSTKEKRWVNLK